MPSSTSNFEFVIPPVPYRKLGVAAVLGLALLILSSEALWRGRGFTPNLSDSFVFWSMQRGRVDAHPEKKKLIVIGTSRAEQGLDLGVLAAEFPGFEVISLVISGSRPMAVLKDLASARFKGAVIADFPPDSLLSSRRKDSKSWVDYYHAHSGFFRSRDPEFNAVIQMRLQERFVIYSPELSLQNLLTTRFRPVPTSSQLRSDRSRPADFARLSKESIEGLRRWRMKRFMKKVVPDTPEKRADFQRGLRHDLLPAVRQLKDKRIGLAVVFMPMSGPRWEWEQRILPRPFYWKSLEATAGVPTVHFEDYPELRVECPDTSHLDSRDAPAFTRSLAEILKREGFGRETTA